MAGVGAAGRVRRRGPARGHGLDGDHRRAARPSALDVGRGALGHRARASTTDRTPTRWRRCSAQAAAAISVYAQGDDYHDLIKKRLKVLARWLAAEAGCEVKVFVDTAPLMEKPLAQAAGLGWQGKHTNLVSRAFGSWLFLGAILTDRPWPPTRGETDHCGACRACLDICPTGAFPAPYQLDARALHLLPDHRARRADPGALAPGPGKPDLRLRRLPGGLPVEQVRPGRARGGAARRARRCKARRWPSWPGWTTPASAPCSPRARSSASAATASCAMCSTRSATRGDRGAGRRRRARGWTTPTRRSARPPPGRWSGSVAAQRLDQPAHELARRAAICETSTYSSGWWAWSI